MGRRSGDAESSGSGLAEDDSGDFAQFAADLVDERVTSCAIGFTALVALVEQRLNPCRCRADEPG